MNGLGEITAWKGVFGPNSRRIFAYLRPQRRKLWIIAALGILYVPLSLVEPYLLLYLVDRVLLGGRPDLLGPFFVRLVPFFLLATCVDFLLNYTLLLIARDLHSEVKSEQLDNLLAKGTSFFRGTASGKLLFSFFNDSNQIGALLSFGVINTLLNLLFVAARLVILWYLDPTLLLAYLSIVPFQVVVIVKVMKVAMRLEIELKGKDEELTARIESLLRGALMVKAFDFGAPLAGIWKNRFASRLNVDLRNMMWKQLGSLTTTNIQAIGVFVVLFLGAWKIEAGTLTLGALLAFIAVSGRVTPSLQTLIGFLVGVQESLVNIERYYRIYDLPDEEAEFRAPRASAGLNGQVALSADNLDEIRARNVLVDHGNGARVRVPCDFSMRRGQSYLWYGPNGIGKTSLGLALAGLIPHQPGTILCGDSALSDFSLRSIRRNILYVGSEPFWPERTLRDNFVNGDGALLDHARLEEALYVSTADQVLSCLPKGMDTILSTDGHILSRGENQRLFLAMVLYRLPTVLVLDESLSNVSDRLLRQIFERLRSYGPECLRIHVSHRLDHQDLLDNWVAFHPLG